MQTGNRRIRSAVNLLSSIILRRPIAFPPVPADNRVLFRRRDRRDFGFLSNFHPCRIRIDGIVWPHVEAYYQAQKSYNPEYRKKILARPMPTWAKHVGDSRVGSRKLARLSWFRCRPEDLRVDWDVVKTEVMLRAIESKFSQNRDLMYALLATKSAQLIEDTTADHFWGSGRRGTGKNTLGMLLMKVRDEGRVRLRHHPPADCD